MTYADIIAANNIYKAANPQCNWAHGLTQTQINSLLSQDGISLDGIRGYTLTDTDGKLCNWFVATQKDANGVHHDYSQGLTVKGRPCPTWCNP